MEPTQETINIAKQLHSLSWISLDLKSALEKEFPELKESEGKRIRKELIGHCKDLVRMNKDDKVLLSIYEPWLAYLEKQKEQKPAEWSEEDEKMLTGIIERGSSQIPSHEPALREEQMEWLMKRLRFLRPQPHWKPSEEQISALNAIILNGSFTYVCQVQDLISLKDELKKL